MGCLIVRVRAGNAAKLGELSDVDLLAMRREITCLLPRGQDPACGVERSPAHRSEIRPREWKLDYGASFAHDRPLLREPNEVMCHALSTESTSPDASEASGTGTRCCSASSRLPSQASYSRLCRVGLERGDLRAAGRRLRLVVDPAGRMLKRSVVQPRSRKEAHSITHPRPDTRSQI